MRRVESLFLEKIGGISCQEGKLDQAPLRAREEFLRKAKSSIKIVDRKLPQEIFSNPGFLETLEEANKRGVKIELITGPDPDEKALSNLASLPISIYRLDQPPTNKFTLVDERYALLEDPFPPGPKQITQYIIDHEFARAPDLNIHFLKLKGKAQPLSR